MFCFEGYVETIQTEQKIDDNENNGKVIQIKNTDFDNNCKQTPTKDEAENHREDEEGTNLKSKEQNSTKEERNDNEEKEPEEAVSDGLSIHLPQVIDNNLEC